MKFSAALVAGFAALGLAKPAITNTVFDLQEGKPFTLNWIDAVGPVKVDLVSGPDSKSLQPVRTLATGETDGSFTFTPSGLPSGNYAFRVTDSDGDPNFSMLFPYVGTAVSSSSSSGSASRTSTRSSTSSSAASSAPVSSEEASSTIRTSTTSTRTTPTRTATTTPTNAPTNNNEGQRFSSSLALVFMTVAALVFFN